MDFDELNFLGVSENNRRYHGRITSVFTGYTDSDIDTDSINRLNTEF